MGKLKCICGNILSDTCGNDAEIFTEDQIMLVGYDIDECYLSGNGRSVLECEECGTLAIEQPIGTNTVEYYKPENCKFNKLFKT